MGLFDLFGKKDNSAAQAKPLESYLEQWGTGILMEGVTDSTLYAMGFDSGNVYCHTDCKVQNFPLKMLDKKYARNVEPIPRCYYQTSISAQALLELAYDKGGSMAAFYLGFLHEHGIGTQQNLEKARQYYIEAAKDDANGKVTFGQLLVKAMDYMKADHDFHMPNFGATQMECLAIDMARMCVLWSESKYYDSIKKIFDDSTYLMQAFIDLGILAVCSYAEKGCPYSTFTIACLMNNEDVPSNIKRVFKYNSQSEIRKCGQKILVRISKQAVSGNQKLVNVLQAHDFPYREVASEY